MSLRKCFFFLFPFLCVHAFGAVISGPDLLTNKTVVINPTAASKATVVVFLSSHCPCSSSHEVTLNALKTEYQDKGFNFVAIHSNSDEDVASAQAHFRKSELKFPVIQDDHAKLADQFGAIKTPHVYILSPKGEILFKGGVDDSHDAGLAKKHFLKDALVAINEGRLPPEKEVRTLGCLIVR